MKPNGLLAELIRRGKRIRNQKGSIALIGGVFGFIVYPFYKRTSYYLYEIPVTPEYTESEARPGINSHKLCFRVLTSNQEANKLETGGYGFRLWPTELNQYLKLYTRWLDAGAIAFCTFVGKEFAAISWVLPSQEAQKSVKAPPLMIDYANHEVMQRGMWVNLKYRGLGLYRYTVRNRDRYLSDRDVKILRTTIDCSNKIGQSVDESFGAKQYGKGVALKILWWRFWKESYYDNSSV